MLVLKTDYSGAGLPRYYFSDNNDMLIDPKFKKCVVFVGYRYQDANGATKEHYGGTAFFLSYPVKPKGQVSYLTTAKHVIDGIKAESEKYKAKDKNMIVRINKHDGTSGVIELPLTAWKFHPTEPEHVDVAVTTILNITQKEFDWLSLPMEWAIDKNKIGKRDGFNEGDDVSAIGLFRHHVGNKKNYPIFRTGNIALFPEEKVYIDKKIGESEIYLIESRSIKGLSGSPVFVSLNPYYISSEESISQRTGQRIFYWLGLVSGHFFTSETDLDFASDENEIKNLNVGISFVIPAEKVVDILNSDKFIAERAKIESILLAEAAKNISLD
ncbi:hypothetical protein M1271_06130 [Patescibacteria group bacterium]|nr:hypothetical protein [Patescibacteria group bacterium]MCL5797883.1 hypothetical protein [Patescibacteria group bacterium]